MFAASQVSDVTNIVAVWYNSICPAVDSPGHCHPSFQISVGFDISFLMRITFMALFLPNFLLSGICILFG
jgi:hypothetical protein